MARGRKSNLVISLTDEERRELTSWQRSTTVRAGLVRRGRIMLLRERGVSLSDIARVVGIHRRFVARWIGRFLECRIEGLADLPGRGRKPASSPGGHVVKLACTRSDEVGRSLSQWDRRELARHLQEEAIVSSISPISPRKTTCA